MFVLMLSGIQKNILHYFKIASDVENFFWHVLSTNYNFNFFIKIASLKWYV